MDRRSEVGRTKAPVAHLLIDAVLTILILSTCRRSLVALVQMRAEIGSRVKNADQPIGCDLKWLMTISNRSFSSLY